MNILITEPEDYCQDALNIYSEIGCVFLTAAPDEQEINILVVRLNINLDSNYLSKYPKLKFIITPTTGLTHIDHNFCTQQSINIISLNNCKDNIKTISSTAELSLGLMIAVVRRITAANNDVINRGLWDRDLYKSRQFNCMSIGIIGLGRVGSLMASYCKALSMKILAYDPFVEDAHFTSVGVKKVSFNTLLQESQIISIHANLHDQNINMISYNELDKMQEGVLIINTARGALLNESAICQAIKSKKIGGIAVDVLEKEHSAKGVIDSELLSLAHTYQNIIITPHIGGCTIDAMHQTELAIAQIAKKTIKRAR